MSSGGPARRASSASQSAASSRSSSMLSGTTLTCRSCDVVVAGNGFVQGGELRAVPQPFQAAGAARADAADLHFKRRADLGIGKRRVADEHPQKLLAPLGELRAPGAQRPVAFPAAELFPHPRRAVA